MPEKQEPIARNIVQRDIQSVLVSNESFLWSTVLSHSLQVVLRGEGIDAGRGGLAGTLGSHEMGA
jgi:hypothetical protein